MDGQEGDDKDSYIFVEDPSEEPGSTYNIN